MNIKLIKYYEIFMNIYSYIYIYIYILWASQAAQMVKNLPTNAGDARDMSSVPGSGRSPEEEIATHSIILA